MRRNLSLGAALCAISLGLILAASAGAAEVPSHSFRFEISQWKPEPNSSPNKVEFFEGPCGLAVDSHGDIYAGDYYHDQVLAFAPNGGYLNRMVKEEPLDGPCGLALDSAGRLYVNNLHRNVIGFALSSFPPLSGFPENNLTTGAGATIDTEHSTGVALDSATGDLYVDDRTYVARYDAPIEAGEPPVAKIGLGNLGNGYGVAVSGFAATEGFLYVPDATSGTVKVYDPATSTTAPVAEIDGAGTPQAGFASLVDSAVAVDDSDGHLFVADNLQSLDTEHPRAALEEFNAAGEYRGSLPKFPTLFESEPTAVAVDNSGAATQGDLYVTSGNSELAKVYAYGPTGPAHALTVTRSGEGEGTVESEPAGIDCGSACAAEYNAGAEVTLIASPAPGSAFAGFSGACTGTGTCTVTMSEARSVGAEFEVAPLSELAQSGTAEPGAASSPEATAQAPLPRSESPPPSATGPSVYTSRRHRHPPHHRRHHPRHRRSR